MKLTKRKVKVLEHCEICKIELREGYEYYKIETAYIDRMHRPQTRLAIMCCPCTEELYPNQIRRVPKPPSEQENLFDEQ